MNTPCVIGVTLRMNQVHFYREKKVKKENQSH